MKKLIALAAAVALAAIAGWSALWFTGRSAVADRIDSEIAQLQAQGFEITHGARTIGGFPFGYQVTHHDVMVREPASGITYRLPEVTTEISAGDIDRLVSRFPAKYRIDVPLSEAQRAGWPGMPEILAIDVESSDLVLTSDGAPGQGQKITATAKSMLVVTGGAEQPLNFAVEFIGLESLSSLPAHSSDQAVTSATTVERLEYAYSTSTPHRIAVNIEASIDNLRITGSSDARDQAAVLAMIAGTGATRMAYQTGANQGIVRTGTGPEQQEGSLEFEAGSTAGILALENGVLKLASSSKANRLTFTGGPDTAAGKPVGGEIRAVEMHITAPFAPSDTMSPIALRFALDQAAPDDALWQLIDAGGKLPRDPVQMVVDVEGTARITGDISDMRPEEALPVEIGNLSIRSADLTALGAGIATRGDVEFLQPIYQPVGAVTITLTKVEELMVNLADAGLIDPASVQMVMIMAMGFAAPGSAPGELVSEIVMSLDGITINGQPFGGN